MRKLFTANNIINNAFALLILAGLVAIPNSDNNSNTAGLICKIVIFISIIIPIAKILKKHTLYFVTYIYEVPNPNWCRQIEKARLVFNALGIVCIAGTLPLLSSPLLNIGDLQYIKYLTCFLIWGIGIYMIAVSWTKNFSESHIPYRFQELSQSPNHLIEDATYTELPSQNEDELLSDSTQRLYDISISNRIIECASPQTLDKIIKGKELNTNEIFNFVYKSQNSQRPPSIRNLMRYIMIITDNIDNDLCMPNDNQKIIDLIKLKSITIDGKKIDKNTINTSAVTKARNTIHQSSIYTLLTVVTDGQS